MTTSTDCICYELGATAPGQHHTLCRAHDAEPLASRKAPAPARLLTAGERVDVMDDNGETFACVVELTDDYSSSAPVALLVRAEESA